MAKLTYLQLTNRVLKRISQPEITDVTTATGQALIITELINEAQNELFTELNWYSLYETRTFSTVASNAKVAVASDWGRTLDLVDTSNNRVLIEDTIRAFDEADPDVDNTGTPTHFSVCDGSNYSFYPIPDGAYTIRDRYWKVPTSLTANANTSDLPIEVENCIIHWCWYKINEYLNKFDSADRLRLEFERLLRRAKLSNNRRIDKMHIFQPFETYDRGLHPVRFPSAYGARYY